MTRRYGSPGTKRRGRSSASPTVLIPDGLARAQLDEMAALCRDLYPSLRLYLYDLRRTYFAPFTVFGPQRAILYLGTIFFVLTSSEHFRVLHRRFDDLVRAAVIQPPEVPEVVAGLLT